MGVRPLLVKPIYFENAGAIVFVSQRSCEDYSRRVICVLVKTRNDSRADSCAMEGTGMPIQHVATVAKSARGGEVSTGSNIPHHTSDSINADITRNQEIKTSPCESNAILQCCCF